MKEYKFEVDRVYTDWVFGKNEIAIVKITEKCVYFRVVKSDVPVDTMKVYRGKRSMGSVGGSYPGAEHYKTERTYFPKYLTKELGYGHFSAEF